MMGMPLLVNSTAVLLSVDIDPAEMPVAHSGAGVIDGRRANAPGYTRSG